jgi:Cytochrome c3/Cytochrome c7 and related cytochrome c
VFVRGVFLPKVPDMKPMFAAAVVFALTVTAFGAASAAEPSNDDCLACHGDQSAKRSNGTSVFIDQTRFAASIHGQSGLACVDCHADLTKTTEFPHPDKLAPVDCASCHDDAAKKFENSAHRRRPGGGLTGVSGERRPTCVDCHGTHDILPASDPASPTNQFNVAATCLKCHKSPAIDRAVGGRQNNRPVNFQDSIHGQALLKSGLKVAPSCVTCHGFHDILPPDNAASTVYRARVPSLCGSCHTKILAEFQEGVHGTALAKGNPKAPVCTDCHTAHEVKRADVPAWKLSVIKECGTCHEQLIETYRDTYHGQVTALGYTRIATCADCHNAHLIFGPTDPRSSVSRGHIVQTCQKCHPGVNANFARYDPHADPQDRKRNPVLYYAAGLMKWLLIGVFGFFGLHTLAWFPASARARRRMFLRKKNHEQ